MSEAQRSVAIGFTNDWFAISAKPIWDTLIPQIGPAKALEIGSFEGASACFLIETCSRTGAFEIHCIDTWEGGAEHKRNGTDMAAVEQRFRQNTAAACANARHTVDLVMHKGYSSDCLVQLLASGGTGTFDFIYIDGSHVASDVLTDAVLSFPLLRVGGLMAFDDYLWRRRPEVSIDALETPKPAIDAFMNIFFHKMALVSSSNSQVFARKTAT